MNFLARSKTDAPAWSRVTVPPLRLIADADAHGIHHPDGLRHVLGRRLDVHVQVDELVRRTPRVGLSLRGGERVAGPLRAVDGAPATPPMAPPARARARRKPKAAHEPE